LRIISLRSITNKPNLDKIKVIKEELERQAKREKEEKLKELRLIFQDYENGLIFL
jgi:ABC-type dipeptide/oligopeptide/nickel transport system ATPase subunit